MYGFSQIDVSPDTLCHQGIATDGVYYYTLNTHEIYKYDSSWNLIASNLLASVQTNITHLGDGAVYNGKLYIAAENYNTCASVSYQRISIFNTLDLSFDSYVDISAQGHECSSLCIVPELDTIFISSFCESKIYKYKLSDFSYLGYIDVLPELLTMQGVTYKNGYLWISSYGDNIYRVSLDGTRGNSSWWKGVNEGIDYTTDYMLVMDGEGAAQVIRFLAQTAQEIDGISTLTINGKITYN